MSKLEELIQELCPNGVEYKTIGEVCDISRGRVMSKDFIRDNEGEYPVYSSQTENNGELGKINTYMFDGEYITWTTDGANAGTVFYRTGKFSVTNVCGLLKLKEDNLLCKFLYYYLTTATEPYVNKGMGNAKLMSNVMAIIKVPIPPMEVQSEIVRILDNFTLLTAELTAELTARKEQYQYYLDMLFESCNGESRTLDEIGVFTRGKRFVHADAVNQDGIPCIHYGELYTYYGVVANQSKSQIRKSILEEKKLRYAKKGDVIIVGAGENDEDIGIGVAWNGDYEVAVHDACYIFETEENPKFISYYLRSSYYHKQIKAYVSRGKICAISSQGIGKAIIKVPSIDEQKRIVDMIEQFYLYSNDITQGLPAEIELRQKQYEYYRNKLLTFKEL